MTELGHRTEGFSGSEIKELCRNAAMLPMRELLREVGDDPEELARLHKEVCAWLYFQVVMQTHTILLGL